jgi:hypothetical protein
MGTGQGGRLQNLGVQPPLSVSSPHRLTSRSPSHAAPQQKIYPFQINALNLVGKISLPSSFGENSRIRRNNAATFRLSTLKVAIKSFVFKGVQVVA